MMTKENIRILHLGKYHPPFMGGIENFMADLMAEQKKSGCKVSAIVHHHQEKQPYIVDYDNKIPVHRVPILGELVYVPISPLFGKYLTSVIEKEKPDVIHIHMPNVSAFWCLIISEARKIPWVIHWHADVLGSAPDIKVKLLYPFYRFFETALLKKAKHVIATSAPYKSASIPLSKVKEKTDVIPLGLKTLPIPTNRGYSTDNTLSLIMVGRLTYYKGHNIVLKALEQLKQKGIVFHLKIIGMGEQLENIKKSIHHYQLNDYVSLMGRLPEQQLHDTIAESDLLCLPSIEKTEAFGVVLLEAMRVGTPCLVSDVIGSGMSWVVKANETGFVVKNNSAISLANALLYISQNKQLLEQYGIAGKARFNDVFSIKHVTADVLDLYQNILS